MAADRGKDITEKYDSLAAKLNEFGIDFIVPLPQF